MNKKMFITKRIFPTVATAIAVSCLYMNVAKADTTNITSSDIFLGDELNLSAGYYEDDTIIDIPTKAEVIARGEITSADIINEGVDLGDAARANVLEGKTFTSSAAGSNATGTMPNNGAKTATLNTGNTSYMIPMGYHNGSGKVSITLEEKSITPTTSSQTITPTSGKVLSKVTVNAIQIQEKTTMAGTSATSVTPESGKYLSKVTVNPTPSQGKSATPTGSNQVIYPDSGKLLSSVSISAVTKTSGIGKTLYDEGYGFGRTQGRSDVTSAPNSYSLYTKSQYDGNYTTGYNAGRTQGRSDVISAPNSYSLYTKSQYDNNYNSGRTQGQNDVKNNPNSYSLYTKSQYDNNYNSGRTQGRSDVTSSPNSYSLYTKSQYDDNYTSGYNNGFDKGKRYILGNRAHHLAVGSAGGSLANCTFNLHDVLDGTTIKFYNMSSGDNKRIVILDAGRGSTTLYDSGYTSSTNLSYTVASGGIISVQLWTKDGTPQYSSFMLENSNY